MPIIRSSDSQFNAKWSKSWFPQQAQCSKTIVWMIQVRQHVFWKLCEATVLLRVKERISSSSKIALEYHRRVASSPWTGKKVWSHAAHPYRWTRKHLASSVPRQPWVGQTQTAGKHTTVVDVLAYNSTFLVLTKRHNMCHWACYIYLECPHQMIASEMNKRSLNVNIFVVAMIKIKTAKWTNTIHWAVNQQSFSISDANHEYMKS